MPSKSDLFKSLWIPVSQRLPPDDPSVWVLILTFEHGIPLTREARQAREDAKRFLSDENVHNLPWAWDRIYSHWMAIERPQSAKVHRHDQS